MVVFGYDCMSLGDLAHEIMHILGFSHEHARTDRDQYISIMWDNIKPGKYNCDVKLNLFYIMHLFLLQRKIFIGLYLSLFCIYSDAILSNYKIL